MKFFVLFSSNNYRPFLYMYEIYSLRITVDIPIFIYFCIQQFPVASMLLYCVPPNYARAVCQASNTTLLGARAVDGVLLRGFLFFSFFSPFSAARRFHSVSDFTRRNAGRVQRTHAPLVGRRIKFNISTRKRPKTDFQSNRVPRQRDALFTRIPHVPPLLLLLLPRII